MPKAGTTWLYDQLSGAPGFIMPPLKELHFFDLDANTRRSNYFQQFSLKRRPVSPEQLAFRDRAMRATTIRDYKLLFKRQHGAISGDMTPAYCGLHHGAIARIARELPDVKIILMVRDPVERVWSFIKALVLVGKLPTVSAEGWAGVRTVLEENNSPGLALASEVWRRWSRYYEVFPIFFDDVENAPEDVMAAVVKNLRGRTSVTYRNLKYNRNIGAKFDMPAVVRSGLVEFFTKELNECADIFGEAGERWRNKYLG